MAVRASAMVKPARRTLLHLQVLRSTQLSPHFRRVTVGGGDIDGFTPMGFDQWFRLFLPTGNAAALDRIPAKAHETLGYLRYLAMSDRPLMRNYTVRGHRALSTHGPQIDIDFVVHGPTDDPTRSAAAWAAHCSPGDRLAIIDEGIGFNPERGVDDVLLVADETGLPAMSGILASLPASARGLAVCEVPDAEDRLEVESPRGVEVRYLVRAHDTPVGQQALSAVDGGGVPGHAWVAGEQGLVSGARRALVGRGLSTGQISFCSYWKLPRHQRVG
ncbi:NADPH-dependent ferric siderophore reductase [Aeromicrobium sp. PE09-221]|uniref:siderophore-interacting protein n=1 Tax=Aeromicrobium sp. PE09-221 TaxID=1898043 RepID=UPI000B3E5DEF|nr:siderophore-interacting protein [Aeromicrobium sp. PE09-221]OUZ12224.1 NADPH-dependent ferric siderophore reductase [Aeromicrobium sp. PE09-221]